MSGAESILKLVMRLSGAIMLLAFPAALLPVEWMAATHRWLGLGEFPGNPLVDYLTRSASVLYGIHGGLLLLLAGQVRRYRAVISYLAGINLLAGTALLLIDLHAGLPWYWVAAEGPSIFAFGVLALWLLRGVPESGPAD
jgi:hypothetical protein